jgi:hypothetical protein
MKQLHKYTKRLIEPLRYLFYRKPKTTYNLVEVFKHERHTYYRFPKEVNMPLERFAMSMSLLERLSSGLSGSEMEKILGEMEKALAAGLSNPKTAALMGAYIHVIRERQNTVIHRDLLLNIAATWIIRGDENPAEINPDIHQQKLTLFEELSKGGAHDFFYSLGIEPLMPLFNISPEELQQLWEYNTVQIRKLTDLLRQLSSHRKAGQREQANSSASK